MRMVSIEIRGRRQNGVACIWYVQSTVAALKKNNDEREGTLSWRIEVDFRTTPPIMQGKILISGSSR